MVRALCPIIFRPPLRVILADLWRVSLRVGDGLDARGWYAETAASVYSKQRRYEDILSGLRLMVTGVKPDATSSDENWSLTLSLSLWWWVFIAFSALPLILQRNFEPSQPMGECLYKHLSRSRQIIYSAYRLLSE